MEHNNIFCVDCGSENCPCYLSQTEDCLMCSRLQGKDYCDCNWKGVCIYNELMQNGGTINELRTAFRAPIKEKKSFACGITVFALKVGIGFAIKCSEPGSYIFVKGENEPSFYQTPISVMKSDMQNGVIYIAVQQVSAKSKMLIAAEDALIVRGVYRNGIIGLLVAQSGSKWVEVV